MKKARENTEENTRKFAPAHTPEERARQCEALAYDLAEKQLRDGTASSQVITHFLKLSTAKAELETEMLKTQTKLYQAKAEALQSAKHAEEMFDAAIKAFRSYQGEDEVTDDDDY